MNTTATSPSAPLVLEKTPCNLCGGNDTELLFRRADSLTRHPHKFSVVRCNRCSLVYVNPRPTPACIGRFYTSEFASYQFDAMDPSGSVAQHLFRKALEALARKRIATVQSAIPLSSSSSVLDIGCGRGFFLHELKKNLQCRVVGLEMDRDAVCYCRDNGVETIEGLTSDLSRIDERFDVITLWHVLEHVHDPVGVLRDALALLKPGGLLVVEVPNQASLESRLLGPASYLYDVPRHLFHFSPSTLTKTFERAGLEMKTLRGSAGAGGWIGSAQQILSGGRIYKDVRHNLPALFLLNSLVQPLDAVSARTRHASVITAIGRKAAR